VILQRPPEAELALMRWWCPIDGEPHRVTLVYWRNRLEYIHVDGGQVWAAWWARFMTGVLRFRFRMAEANVVRQALDCFPIDYVPRGWEWRGYA
jgi:hypothetical protein